MIKKRLFPGMEKIPRNALRDLFFTMLKIRRVEEVIAELYPAQEMRCPVHLCVGQEAVPAAVSQNLLPHDVVFASHRSHGYYIAQGAGLRELFAELYGKADGCTKGKGGSQHLASPRSGLIGSSAIVAGTIPIAVGAALAFRMQRKRSVAAAAFGDGAVDQGVFYESLNFASLKKLPVIFVCENNLYATHAHQSERQARDNIFRRAGVFGMPGVRVNGNDVVQAYLAFKKAVARARAGAGPTLIEYRTYRWLEHVGPYDDSNLGYRAKSEVESWKKRCPIAAFRDILLRKKILSPAQVASGTEKIERRIRDAVLCAQRSAFPPEQELCSDVCSG